MTDEQLNRDELRDIFLSRGGVVSVTDRVLAPRMDRTLDRLIRDGYILKMTKHYVWPMQVQL